MAKLHFIDKNFEGRVYELVVERTTVGRGEQNTLVIADDSVSSSHCDILVYGSEVIVRERGSSNGTFVDEVRVEGQMPVHNGQSLRFGSVVARVEIEPSRNPEDTTTDLTAVYEYGKVMREQRREKKKAAGAHLRIEPSAAHVATEEEQTVLLPNPRSTQKIRPPTAIPAAAPESRPRPAGKKLRYLIAAVLALLAAIVIWLVRRG
jgi:hypothetical protein